jgi:hypothetical protein
MTVELLPRPHGVSAPTTPTYPSFSSSLFRSFSCDKNPGRTLNTNIRFCAPGVLLSIEAFLLIFGIRKVRYGWVIPHGADWLLRQASFLASFIFCSFVSTRCERVTCSCCVAGGDFDGRCLISIDLCVSLAATATAMRRSISALGPAWYIDGPFLRSGPENRRCWCGEYI